MTVLAELKALKAKRFEHEAAIQEIDAQLEDARELLGGLPVRDDAPAVRRKGHLPGMPRRTSDPDHLTRTERQILDSLASIQPQTVKMLDSRIDVATVGLNMKPLVDRGLVVRRMFKLKGEDRYSRYPYWYALTVESLDRMGEQLRLSGQLQDEAPPDPSRPSEEPNRFTDGTLSDTDLNGIAPTTADVSARSVTLNASNGSGK